MRIPLLSLVIMLFAGCMYRVDVTSKHSDVIGEWRLKTDAYLTQYDDDYFMCHLIACTSENALSLPNRDTAYSESRFGSKGDGMKIVGGLRKGSVIKIEQIIEDHHATMGISYEPFAKISDMNGRNRKTNLFWYYRNFASSKILNPEWAEKLK